MKIIYLFLLLIGLPFTLNSQIVYTTPTRSQIYDGMSNTSEWDYRKRDTLTDMRYKVNKTLSDYKYEQIIGNAYFEKEFVTGNVLYNNKVVSKKYALRYNAYRDEIEVSNNGITEYLTKNSKISCLIGNQKYEYLSFLKKENGNSQIGYLKIIYVGDNFVIYERNIKKYKAEKKAKNSFATPTSAKLVDSNTYYFSNTKDVIVQLNRKKKVFLSKVSSEHQSEMAKFLKANQLNLNTKKDIIIFFKHYNSLNLN